MFLNTNPIQGYVHSIHIPLNYDYYENKLLENNKLMKNQTFSVCVNKNLNLRIVRFNGNVSDLWESTTYEILKIEDTEIFTMDFVNVSYTIDKMTRGIEKYGIDYKKYQNYQNLAKGCWTSQDGGILYIGCQDVLKDSPKVLSKNERVLNLNIANTFEPRDFNEMDYFSNLEKMEVKTNSFIMFQILLDSPTYFTLLDINAFVRKYAPMIQTQQINRIMV